MRTLDDTAVRDRLDPGGMMDLVLGLGAQCAAGWDAGMRAPLPSLPGSPSAIAVMGMGGSGIGGDLLRALLAREAPVPVAVVKDYRPPRFLSRGVLAFACSYSGDTEETLAAFDAARESGATLAVVTSGGALLQRASQAGVPAVIVPSGLPPRASLGYMFFPMLAVLQRLGLVRNLDGEVAEARGTLQAMAEEYGPARPAAQNPAKQLARKLPGRIPVVYAASALLEPVATRWRTQFNENSKTYAACAAFPELNHNETVGWGLDAHLASHLHVILLRDTQEDARVTKRVTITREIALRPAAGIDEVRARGSGALARMFSSILYGDLVSVYLAYLLGVDPTPVPVIDELKRRLAE